jgi:hypothetical protein
MAQEPARGRLPWRRWNAAIHRDVGYLSVALTLAYALSGLAVNHIASWNPNYVKTREVRRIAPMDPAEPAGSLIQKAQAQLRPEGRFKNAFQPDDDTLQLFYDRATYAVDLPTGQVLVDATRPRPVLHALNQLHLNAPKRLWTAIADLYAGALIVLALSGLFILRGPKGALGRGLWFVGAGLAVPLCYWLWWRYLA